MPLESSEALVRALEAQTAAVEGKRISWDALGAILGEARRLYLRQLEPARLDPQSGKPWGPFVGREEVLEPFSSNLLRRLEGVIATLEQSTDAVVLEIDFAPIPADAVRVPTRAELKGITDCADPADLVEW